MVRHTRDPERCGAEGFPALDRVEDRGTFVLRRPGVGDDLLREARLGEIALQVKKLLQIAILLRVIGDRDNIIWRPLLYRLAGGRGLNLLALGKVVGVLPRRRDPSRKGVERVTGVHVLLAEVDVFQRVLSAGTAARFTDGVRGERASSEQR